MAPVETVQLGNQCNRGTGQTGNQSASRTGRTGNQWEMAEAMRRQPSIVAAVKSVATTMNDGAVPVAARRRKSIPMITVAATTMAPNCHVRGAASSVSDATR